MKNQKQTVVVGKTTGDRKVTALRLKTHVKAGETKGGTTVQSGAALHLKPLVSA
jgi:hypothetical protein